MLAVFNCLKVEIKIPEEYFIGDREGKWTILDLLRFSFIKSKLHCQHFSPSRNSLILCHKISVNLIMVTSNPNASVPLEPSLSSSVQNPTYYLIKIYSGKMPQGLVLAYYNTFTKLIHYTMNPYLRSKP